MNRVVREVEQAYMIRRRLAEAGVQHGDSIIAKISAVQQPQQGHLRLCYIGPAAVHFLARGDNGQLPESITGLYDLVMPNSESEFDLYLHITSNGRIEVRQATREEKLSSRLAKKL